MLMPPADSPKTVTLPGSPPKAAMLSRTQLEGGDLVEEADVAGAGVGLAEPGEVQEAEGAEAVVDRHDDDVVARRPGRRRSTRGSTRRRW